MLATGDTVALRRIGFLLSGSVKARKSEEKRRNQFPIECNALETLGKAMVGTLTMILKMSRDS